jgi:glutaconate CoA-transferase subunit A
MPIQAESGGGARVMQLPDAIAGLANDGDAIALEGFTHLIPFGAAHELSRQRRTELTLIRLTPDLIYDQMIGMGLASKLIFSYGGNPGVGSLHRFRDAVENGWPRDLEIVEHSHAGLANAYVAGASRLPFAVLRGYSGTGLLEVNSEVKAIRCPFTGEELTAVRAVNPDLSVIHAQWADRDGNVMLWGLTGVQKEAALAAKRVLVTVEELVESLEPRPHAVMLPSWTIDAVAVVPGGSWPSYALGYSTRDNAFYEEWDGISRDRERFRDWMEANVLGASAPAGVAR